MASNWSYRTVKHTDENDIPYLGIHVIFLSEDGRIESMDDEPIIEGESVEDLSDQVKALLDAIVAPALDADDVEMEILAGLDIAEIDEP